MRYTFKTSASILLASLLAASALTASGARAELSDGGLTRAIEVDVWAPHLSPAKAETGPAGASAKAQGAEQKLLIATCRKKC